MKVKSGGLQRRWLRNSVGLMAVMILVIALTFAAGIAAYYYSNMSSTMEAKVKTTTDFLMNNIDQSSTELYLACANAAKSFEDKEIMEMQFVDKDMNLVATSYGEIPKTVAATTDITEALSSGKNAVFQGKNPKTGERIMAVSSPVIFADGTTIGVIRCVTSLHEVDRQILLFAGLILAVGLLIVLIVYLSNRMFIRRIVEPVADITAISKRIAAGSYGVQIQKKYRDEIGELADTINDMSNKISQSEKMQSEFVSSVSHELRTPLTAITGWGETILISDHLDKEERRGMETILRESKRLTGMVEELLEFTRIQDGRFTLNVSQCDIRTEFEDTVFMYGSRLKQEGIALDYLENDDDIPEINCDPARMRQVFLNVLDNAAKHGGEGKRITAEMCLEGENVVVRIRDFGPGIPEEELPHIKKKFYKGSSKVRGSGIGLAVCEEIVSMHSGLLDIANAEGGGTLVTISLPVGE
ncbi:MAG: HAMP domain-containing histidine kinase [Clostridia bacterium]|nr:HAMP domain-containing histidine kinase [Clostridia bacterium]